MNLLPDDRRRVVHIRLDRQTKHVLDYSFVNLLVFRCKSRRIQRLPQKTRKTVEIDAHVTLLAQKSIFHVRTSRRRAFVPTAHTQ